MSTRGWAVCAIVVAGLANTGCVTQCHKSYEKSWEHCGGCDIPPRCRGQVYVFMMHGLTPSTDCGLEALRVKLGECGFAKVGTGELCHARWVKDEIGCILQHDPDARFVLVGYDYGAATAVALARDLTAKDAAVHAVVLLDPLGCGTAPTGVPTLLITTATAPATAPHSERVVVPDATHFGLPTHPATVSALTALLKDVALRNCVPPIEMVPGWNYPDAPEMRPDVTGKVPDEWNFLADRPGAVPPIGTRVVTKPTTPVKATPVAARR